MLTLGRRSDNAATGRLGITLASLGLGWVGKPVFTSLLAPVLKYFNFDPAQADWPRDLSPSVAFGDECFELSVADFDESELSRDEKSIEEDQQRYCCQLQDHHWNFVGAHM